MEVTEKKIVGARKPTRLREAANERSVWQYVADNGITFEDVQKPDFWAHVGRMLKPNDRIEVVAEDFSWFAELIVLAADRLWAKVGVLRYVELTGKSDGAEAPSPDYEVAYKGPTKKHCVIRKADNQIVQEGIALKTDAEAWVREHVKALAR